MLFCYSCFFEVHVLDGKSWIRLSLAGLTFLHHESQRLYCSFWNSFNRKMSRCPETVSNKISCQHLTRVAGRRRTRKFIFIGAFTQIRRSKIASRTIAHSLPNWLKRVIHCFRSRWTEVGGKWRGYRHSRCPPHLFTSINQSKTAGYFKLQGCATHSSVSEWSWYMREAPRRHVGSEK